MDRLSLAKIHIPGLRWRNYREIAVSGIEHDSRKVRPGVLFVAMRGGMHNGEEFAPEAVEKGAIAIIGENIPSIPKNVPVGTVPCCREALSLLCAEWWGFPGKKLTVIGITGTNGKTTTSFLLASILEAAGHKTGLIGTTGCYFGASHIPLSHTTPDPMTLQENLAAMVENGISHVVLEVSSHALAQKRVHGIDFHAAIFTNLSRDHLDYHDTMEDYLATKAILFRQLAPNAHAILNGDDPAALAIAKETQANAYFFGVSNPAKVIAQNIRFSDASVSFSATTPAGTIEICAPLPGMYNVYNLLAAMTCSLALGIISQVASAVKTAKVPGRMEAVECGQPFTVLIDYAHTPDALESALKSLVGQGKLLLVFGCGGDRDKGKRSQMGSIAEHYADYVWVTSDNPRSEPPEEIARQICRGFCGKNHCVELNRKQAICQALAQAVSGDVVLIAGKGHEFFQILSDGKHNFDDCDVAKKFLQGVDFEK